MRIILDLHVSGKRVGRALSAAGHDVRAADAEGEIFDAMEDERLLAVAASEERVLVSRNVRDFPRIVGASRKAARRSHYDPTQHRPRGVRSHRLGCRGAFRGHRPGELARPFRVDGEIVRVSYRKARGKLRARGFIVAS
ncbi:MAG: DUF5615 family PIN-like protein [Rubrobacteraceae bacterium]